MNANSPVVTAPTVLCLADDAGLGPLPLVAGLEKIPEVSLVRRPAGELAEALTAGLADAALVSLMDLQHAEHPLTIIPAGCISCADTSVTVQLLCHMPPEDLDALLVRDRGDTASVLARLIWLHTYGRRLEILPFLTTTAQLPPETQAVLLAGDQALHDRPAGFQWQLDLGSLWFEMTGLPLVMSVWAAGAKPCSASLYRLLIQARRLGEQSAKTIAAQRGLAAGWPVELAVRYLTRDLRFDFADEQREGVEEFFDLAQRAGIIELARPLRIYQP